MFEIYRCAWNRLEAGCPPERQDVATVIAPVGVRMVAPTYLSENHPIYPVEGVRLSGSSDPRGPLGSRLGLDEAGQEAQYSPA
ncbi:hypothetical protein GN244_ATG05911 [Phytophthora infestans]|uniref:Uncharacterized protein n=1 Tax=Phytophthora infestans TaxID=4787 RepID=A0A833TEA2_PHYIN|nr:hypothetical protein GN244_ATG05911 [Phytophthora infestans]